jgi:hypothetical protein
VPPVDPRRQSRRVLSALNPRDLSKMIQFDPKLISAEDYEEFMNFVEGIWGHPGRGLLQHRFFLDKALYILHKANYSLPRAKFYVQFPVLYQMELYSHEEDASKMPSSRRAR